MDENDDAEIDVKYIIEVLYNGLYKCGFCDSTFQTRGLVKRHQNIYHLNMQFKCTICNKVFKCQQYLTAHIKIHVRAFKCNSCDRSFDLQDQLEKHQRKCNKMNPIKNGYDISTIGTKKHSQSKSPYVNNDNIKTEVIELDDSDEDEQNDIILDPDWEKINLDSVIDDVLITINLRDSKALSEIDVNVCMQNSISEITQKIHAYSNYTEITVPVNIQFTFDDFSDIVNNRILLKLRKENLSLTQKKVRFHIMEILNGEHDALEENLFIDADLPKNHLQMQSNSIMHRNASSSKNLLSANTSFRNGRSASPSNFIKKKLHIENIFNNEPIVSIKKLSLNTLKIQLKKYYIGESSQSCETSEPSSEPSSELSSEPPNQFIEQSIIKIDEDENPEIIETRLETIEIPDEIIIPKKYRTNARRSKKTRHVCNICGKSFTQSFRLNDHVTLIHLGIERYKCDICNLVLASKYNLETHKNYHVNGKQFKCDICRKEFSQKTRLRDHRALVHFGIKSYECDLCNFKTVTKYKLKIHQQTHDGDCPFECQFCSQRYSQKSNLNRHLAQFHNPLLDNKYVTVKLDPAVQQIVHPTQYEIFIITDSDGNESKIYKCNLCDGTFQQENFVMEHIKAVHLNSVHDELIPKVIVAPRNVETELIPKPTIILKPIQPSQATSPSRNFDTLSASISHPLFDIL